MVGQEDSSNGTVRTQDRRQEREDEDGQCHSTKTGCACQIVTGGGRADVDDGSDAKTWDASENPRESAEVGKDIPT